MFREGTFVKCKKPTMYINDILSDEESKSLSSESGLLQHASVLEDVDKSNLSAN